MKNKDNAKQLIEAIEKLSGKKVILEDITTDVTLDPTTGLTTDPTASITSDTPSVIVSTTIESGTDLIPLSALNEIKAHVIGLNEQLEEGINKLTNINPESMSQGSNTDYYGVAEDMKNILHKLARINQFVENSVRINKFDKDLLTKVLIAQ